MALHGSLARQRQAADVGLPGQRARRAAARAIGSTTLPAPLRVRAQRLAGDAGQAMYRFELRDAHDRLLVEGRATVVLDTPLASPMDAAPP